MSGVLNDSQFQCLLRLMTLIAACEGGKVAISQLRGYSNAFIKSEIPESLWCNDCKSKLMRIDELKDRWLHGR